MLPYSAALTLILRVLYELSLDASRTQRGITGLALAVSLAVLAMITVNLIVPALVHKEPPLSSLMKTITILFSILESGVIGTSMVLLLCSSRRSLQVGLFGVLIMHISDMALRYQSVKLDLMGMSIFENGWCLGLGLMAIGSLLFLREEQREDLGNDHAQLPKITWLPLASIRGITIGFILAGFITLWLCLSLYFKILHSATLGSGSLLILVFSFAFSVLVADFVTGQVTSVILKIEKRGEFETALNSPFMPYEIKVITDHFRKLTGEIAFEKDKMLSLTSGVSHDLRNPLRALRRIIPIVKEDIGIPCGCQARLEEHLATIDSCIKLMTNTAEDLLKSRKAIANESEPVGEAIQNAARLARLSCVKNEIVVKMEQEIPTTQVRGLTRALGNLILNAVEASQNGTPITVLAMKSPLGCEIVVKDQGAGMSRELIQNIKSGKSLTTKEDGNGLGLPSVISWANQHGIGYEIVSELGQGTEIRLQLPAA